MATADQLLAKVRADIGYKEYPKNSNLTKYGKWYGLNGQPWCMMAVQYWFNAVGALALLPKRTASCTEFMNAAKAKGQWVTSGYKQGDVVLYNFNGKKSPAQHVGIVESVEKSYLNAIEGNTSLTNQDNGGCVMRRSRKYAYVIGAFRPKYDTAKKSLDVIAREVLDGKWGNGDTRKARLKAAGYEPSDVQAAVNALASGKPKKPLDVIAAECADGIHGNGLIRKAKLALLGYTSVEIAQIQQKVNALLKG